MSAPQGSSSASEQNERRRIRHATELGVGIGREFRVRVEVGPFIALFLQQQQDYTA